MLDDDARTRIVYVYAGESVTLCSFWCGITPVVNLFGMNFVFFSARHPRRG